MSAIFKPMLAGKFDPAKQRFPVLASPKLDGIRCLTMNGKPKSRSMKDLPNRHLQKWFADNASLLEGLDGEIIVGDPTAEDVFRTTTSHVMSEDKVFSFVYHVFDRWNRAAGYKAGLSKTVEQVDQCPPNVTWVDHLLISNAAELDRYEAEQLDLGYEGIMVRSLDGPYKQGRSSTNEGYLLKVKRWEDNEAEIIGFNEEMFNGNEAQTNELGRTKRSSAQAGKSGKNTLGTLHVRGINGHWQNVEFDVGGFTDQMADDIWANRDSYLGKIVTYKHFMVGAKDKPRFPGFKGFRDRMDFEAAELPEETVTNGQPIGGWGSFA